MWVYEQSTGKLYSQSGNCVGTGYSGLGNGKNNPAFQAVKGMGPIPVGFYNVEEPVDTNTHGPYVLRLDPFASNTMFERDGFLMHGDSLEHPGAASLGCIIQARPVRALVWTSGDHQLEVVAVYTPSPAA